MTDYERLVAAMKALSQEPATTSEPAEVLPVAENGWNTRPDADSYGVIALEFEADALSGDDVKLAAANEGSIDLYSRKKDGDGWIPLIRAVLQEHCGAAWRLNHKGQSGCFTLADLSPALLSDLEGAALRKML